MSHILTAACYQLEGLSAPQRAVLVSLADQANSSGVCWPSVKHIERRTCLSQRTVQEALRWLQSTGAIYRDFRENTSTIYTVTPESFDLRKAPLKRLRPSASISTPSALTARPPAPIALGDAPVATPLQQTAHQGVARGAPKSKGNRIVNRKEITNESIVHAVKEAELPKVVQPFEEIREMPQIANYPSSAAKTHKAWMAYARSYNKRYKIWPIWNSAQAAKISCFVDRVGPDMAPEVASFYVDSVNEEVVVREMHSLGVLLYNAEKWLVQKQTGRMVTRTSANQADRTQANMSVAEEAAQKAIEMLRGRREKIY